VRLFNENGSRNVSAERQLEHLNELEDKYESMTYQLAEKTAMLGKKMYVPPTDEEAMQLHREAQRMAAGIAHEVIATLRAIMLNSPRPAVQVDAAKALFEIGSRIAGGDGKAGPVPGTHVLVIDSKDMSAELEKRKKAGAL